MAIHTPVESSCRVDEKYAVYLNIFSIIRPEKEKDELNASF
jgi:hypothetical protein